MRNVGELVSPDTRYICLPRSYAPNTTAAAIGCGEKGDERSLCFVRYEREQDAVMMT